MRRPSTLAVALAAVLLAVAAGCGDGSDGVAGPGPGGMAADVALAAPEGLALDADGNLYVSEFEGHRVGEIAQDGTYFSVAGTGTAGFSGDDGGANSAQLDSPAGLVVTEDGRLFIADHHNDRIRVVGVDGFVTTVPGSVAAKLSDPIGIALDDDGDLVVADELNARVVRIDPEGAVTVLAGGPDAHASPGDGGAAAAAALQHPSYVVLDGDGNVLFTDFEDNRIRKIDADGLISTIAGTGSAGFSGDGGPAVEAALDFPTGLALGRDGDVYVSDADNHRVRRIDRDGTITTVAGNGKAGFGGDGGPATEAMLQAPAGLAVDGAGNLYIADQGNDRVRRVDTDGVITTIAGGGA